MIEKAQQTKIDPSIMQHPCPLKVRYKNYKGIVAEREIVPMRVWFGATDWHPQEQWLMEVWDCERQAVRVYAMKDIQAFL